MPSPPVDFPFLLRFGGQRAGEQSESQGTDKPNGLEPHNGLLYCYEGINITGKKVVNHPRTKLNDALIECCAGDPRFSHNEIGGLSGPPAHPQNADMSVNVVY